MRYSVIAEIVGLSFLLFGAFSGCWAVAAGVGTEAGYVASQENRSASETIDDQLIVSSIKTKFLADPEISGLKINVDSYKGNVTLRGFIKEQREIDKAIRVASLTGGVKSVTSQLVVD